MKQQRMAVFFILFLLSGGMVSPRGAQAKDPLWDLDQVSNATVLLYQQITNSSARIGSGTIIARSGRYYILTASHVAKELQNNAKVVFRLKGDKPGIFDLQLIAKDKPPKWEHHSIADIAITELDAKSSSIKTIFQNCAFPFELIHSGKELPKHDVDLTFLGYPIVDMQMEHFSPLTFTGYLSSGLITQLRYDTKTKCNFFYLNVPSIEGCSGSGVFFSVKKAFYICIFDISRNFLKK